MEKGGNREWGGLVRDYREEWGRRRYALLFAEYRLTDLQRLTNLPVQQLTTSSVQKVILVASRD